MFYRNFITNISNILLKELICSYIVLDDMSEEKVT